MRKYFIALCVALLSFACGSGDATLLGTTWHLQEINGKAVNRNVLADSTSLTLRLEQHGTTIRVMAIGDMNNLNSVAKIDEESKTISISKFRMTRMMAKNPELERQFATLLNAAATYSIEGDELTLLDKSGKSKALFTVKAVSPAKSDKK